MKYDYDILVIGSGSGWLTVALWLASAGKKVALVERGKIGGDCTNYGCVPSKALIDVARTGKYSFNEGLVEMRRRRKIIQDEETPEKIEKHGLRLIAWFASFKDAHTVFIDGKDTDMVTAKYIVISTGSHPKGIEISGVKNEDILTNESIFELTENLRDLVVLGGGYIGCELAEAFLNLWVRVTIIQRNDRLVPREEKESSELLRESFESKGMKILTDSSIEKAEEWSLVVTDANGNIQRIRYDKILVALGREPNIEGLALDNAGILSNKGIIVDSYNRTNIKNVFAIGDCVDGNPQFTHWANNEGRWVVRNILVPFWKNSLRNAILPAVLYTNTEIARVGKTEEDILQDMTREDFRTEILHFDTNDRSRLTNDTQGFVKIHFKRVSGKILGATIMGTKAGEKLPILILAMEQGISAYKLSKTVFPYPTKSEIIKKVSDRFVVATLINIRREIIFLAKENLLQIFAGLLWVSILVGFLYFKNQNAYTNLDIAKSFYRFLVSSYWGPLIYIIAYAVRPVILFPATLLTFMSGALFGPLGGFIYTMIGENLSANFAYRIGRVFGKKIIPAGSIGMLADLRLRFERESFIPVLMTRFLFFPFDLVNYGAGVLKAHWSGFFWGTFLGIIPGALVFVLAGASVENIETFDTSKIHFSPFSLSFSVIIFILSLVFAKGLRKWETDRKRK